MQVLDPLKHKIHSLLVEGQPIPLNQGRLRFGTEADIETAIQQFKKLKPSDDRAYALIDLTPFDRVGRLEELTRSLLLIQKPYPVFMVMGTGVVYQELTSYMNKDPMIMAVFSDDGKYYKTEINDGADKFISNIVQKDLSGFSTLPDLRNHISNINLTSLLFKPGCLEVPSPKEPHSRLVEGRWFREMPNGMLISSFLNLKEIGKDCEALTSLAYEIVLVLTGFFRRDYDALRDFNLMIAPNNTALFLASAVQAILEKPVICIDRLGPIPSLDTQGGRAADKLRGKDVVLIEEVVATGNEVDRTLLFLANAGAKVRRIIAVYNLEVGKPLLIKGFPLNTLCNPKQVLNYVYRSQ